MQLSIVYEDAQLMVINKPSGIAMHKTHANDQRPTIADLAVKHYAPIARVGEDPLRPGIVHRLDRETSGLVIIAKTNDAFAYLKQQFQERKIQKTYLALVHGQPKSQSGTIDAALGKIGTRQTTQIKGRHLLQERQALTEYRVLQTFAQYSLLEVSPKTGRTHQIRVHLKSIGHPIVGDPLYGPRKAKMPSDLKRLFLHAQRLAFTTPDGKSLALEADLPDDLARTLAALA